MLRSDLVTQNITSDNGRVVVSSQEKSISTLDITSGSDEGDHIVLQAGDRIFTKNLLANELGTVRITSGKYLEQDSSIVGDITTESITGKLIRVESTGNFTASGDALADDGKISVTTHDDIQTKKIESVTRSINLVSTDGEVTIDGELISGKDGIGIIAKDDITTQKINSAVKIRNYPDEIYEIEIKVDLNVFVYIEEFADKPIHAWVRYFDKSLEVGEFSIDIPINDDDPSRRFCLAHTLFYPFSDQNNEDNPELFELNRQLL